MSARSTHLSSCQTGRRPAAIRRRERRKNRMFNTHRQEIEWGGRKLVLETGRMARQADGAVLATYGETVVLATAVGETEPKAGLDFLPLTGQFQEKFFSPGKNPRRLFQARRKTDRA